MQQTYFIYILFSEHHNKYYVGYSNDPWRRLEEHNNSPFNTFTSKHRPWKIAAVFACGNEEGYVMKLEKFIKKQKSRRLLEQLKDPTFIPNGYLVKLVRVPH